MGVVDKERCRDMTSHPLITRGWGTARSIPWKWLYPKIRGLRRLSLESAGRYPSRCCSGGLDLGAMGLNPGRALVGPPKDCLATTSIRSLFSERLAGRLSKGFFSKDSPKTRCTFRARRFLVSTACSTWRSGPPGLVPLRDQSEIF